MIDHETIECFSTAVEYICYNVVLCIACIIVAVTTNAAAQHMFIQQKASINPWLKLLFFIGAFSMMFVLLSAMISNFACVIWSNTHYALLFWYLIPTGMPTLFGSLLATFLIRLHITFKQSLFALSTFMEITIWCSFILFVIQAIASLVCLWIGWFGQNGQLNVDRVEMEYYFWTLALSSFSTYLICSAVAVSIFTTKLFRWARSRKDTVQRTYIGSLDERNELENAEDNNMNELDQHHERKSIALNRTQRKIIQMATRYIILFMVTAVCSVICYVTCFMGVDTFNPSVLWSMDCVTNILCLYFQYPWATHWYDRTCGKVDGCCRKVISNNVKANLKRTNTVQPGGTSGARYLLMSSI